MPDWRESPLDQRDRESAANLGKIFAGKGKGPKFDLPEDLPLPGIAKKDEKGR